MKIENKRSFSALRFGQKGDMIKDCKCPFCAERVDKDELRNEVFKKEFETTGLCQGCLDLVFGYMVAW
jgi:hypothetical protein